MTRHHRAVAAGQRIVTKSDRPHPTRVGRALTPVLPAGQCALRIHRAVKIDIAGLRQLVRGHSEADVAQVVAAEFFRPGRRVRDRLPGQETRSKNSRQLQSVHHWLFRGLAACVYRKP
jgi:hypothetical protein